MITWDNDIRFLASRVDQQSDYLASVLNDMLPAPYGKGMHYSRAVELMTSAFKQRFYFEGKLWTAFQKVFKPGMEVRFKTFGNEPREAWVIWKVYVEDDFIFIKDMDDNCCINAPYRAAGDILDELEIINSGGFCRYCGAIPRKCECI